MSVLGKLYAKFGLNRANRSIISGAVNRDRAGSAQGYEETFSVR
jgi:hypothetical protein